MERAKGRILFFYLFGITSIFSVLLLVKGGLYLDRHEGDTLHLIEILLRMSRGEWPHLDFVTPLGVAAFWPMAVFVQSGVPLGLAALLGQIAMAIVLLPMIWWVTRTRMSLGLGYAYGAAVVILTLALVHGEAQGAVSISMHYNRWCWALAFLAVPLAVFGPRYGGSQGVDGVIIGVAMGYFILTKVTYGVALAPGLVLALVLRGAWRTMGIGISTVLVVLLIPTVFGGAAYWQAYMGDLLVVAGSEIRPRAGAPLAWMLTSPLYVVGNLALLGAIWLLRRGERPDLALVLIVLALGFIYITYQNFGNDPKWLALVALILVLAADTLWNRSLALVAAVAIAPSFWNMGVSPIRHLLAQEQGYVEVLPEALGARLYTPQTRVNRVMERRLVRFDNPEFAGLNAFGETVPELLLQGETIEACQQSIGMLGVYRAAAADLKTWGLPDDAQIFTADTSGAWWIWGGGQPLRGAAPWYYGRLTGLENATHLLVPACPTSPHTLEKTLSELNAQKNLPLTELRRTRLYTLYKMN